ncbi:MAG: pyrroline-5-carboxylate reductase [Thermomicrobiales bacterium]
MTDSEQANVLEGRRVAVLGCGIMGEAMIASMLKGGLVGSDQVVGAEPIDWRRNELANRYDFDLTESNADAIEGADVVLLTVKPQSLDAVFSDLRGKLTDGQVVVSIAAGATISRLLSGLGHPQIVRAMPNTPSQIGQGMTVWMATPDVSEAQSAMVAAVLSAMGKAVRVKDENEVDMATALSGTGPAYIFMMMEALIDAGVHLGFSRHIAEELVLQTILGSVLFARDSDLHPAELRNMVTSPGGTTANALYHMEKGGLRTVVARAVWAAYERTVELGAGDSTPTAPREFGRSDSLDD